MQINAGGSDFSLHNWYFYNVTANAFPLIIGSTATSVNLTSGFAWTNDQNGNIPDTIISRLGANSLGVGTAVGGTTGTFKAAHLFAGANEVTTTAAVTTKSNNVSKDRWASSCPRNRHARQS